MIIRARESGVTDILIPGFDLPSSIKAVEIARKYGFFASCGLHPHDAKKFGSGTIREFESLAKKEKCVVAIGEIGLDFYKNYSPREVQVSVFHEFLQLACNLKKPVILHVRNAYAEVFRILEDYNSDLPSVILHCFSGGPEEVEQIRYKDNFFISFSGTITYKNPGLIKAAKITPENKLLIETDAPYLTPSQERGRNEPSFVKHVLNKMALLRNKRPEEISELTFQNTHRAFKTKGNSPS